MEFHSRHVAGYENKPRPPLSIAHFQPGTRAVSRVATSEAGGKKQSSFFSAVYNQSI
jgi:hypothetical protein